MATHAKKYSKKKTISTNFKLEKKLYTPDNLLTSSSDSFAANALKLFV